MSLNNLQSLCKQLRLAHVAQIVEEKNDLHYSAQVEDLLNLEVIHRQSTKLARLVKQAGFSALKTFEGYSFDAISFQGKYDQETIRKLEWIDLKENIILMGNVGTGKTHMSIALGIAACQRGKSVKFYKACDLVETLELKHLEGRSSHFRKALMKYDLLIIDEIGYIPFSQTGSELLFNVIAECYEKQSLMITTNLQFKEWESIFGSNKLTAAMIDRLVHHGDIISFEGTSYRLKKALGEQ
jgi:DNA replication protein DnaC